MVSNFTIKIIETVLLLLFDLSVCYLNLGSFPLVICLLTGTKLDMTLERSQLQNHDCATDRNLRKPTLNLSLMLLLESQF
jgi:hypothetical protein